MSNVDQHLLQWYYHCYYYYHVLLSNLGKLDDNISRFVSYALAVNVEMLSQANHLPLCSGPVLEIEETSDEDDELNQKQDAGAGTDNEQKPRTEQAEPDEKPPQETAKEPEQTSEEPKSEEKEKTEEIAPEEETAQEPTEGEERPQESNRGEEDQIVENAEEQPGDGEGDGENEGEVNIKKIFLTKLRVQCIK